MRMATLGITALLLTVLPTLADDDSTIERLATCRDSWLDWQKANDPRLTALAARLRADYTRKPGDAVIVPKKLTTLAGFRVLRVFPDSVGMAVGFSVMLDATFDKAKTVFEKKLGKTLTHCETGDGMKNCEYDIAEKRSFTLTSGDKPGDHETLVGCYYFYEK
ncbi:MAG: hypothetical protein JSR60_05705 [Proteobacteria bacterium]|nr:hypothetical protein [Pseudomonadota bacterium]